MRALVFERSLPRYAAAAVAGRLKPGGGAKVGPLRLADVDEPALPGPSWVRVHPRLAGICGSDLATIDGKSSRYFEPIVSFPFVPGHEIVGELDDGTRVVVMATLTCGARGIDPVCDECATGRTNRCERIAFGHLEPGLQTGFCTDTGGGWSQTLVAHESQLVPVPDDLSDEDAVMIEPLACALNGVPGTGSTAVIGSGTLGLLAIAAACHRTGDGLGHPLVATAKHPEQHRWALALGADRVVAPGELERAVRAEPSNSAMVVGDQLTDGFATVVDCVGSEQSIAQALRVVAPGGTVRLVGMPGRVSVDLTSLWHREVSLQGAYAYTRAHFDEAIEVVRRLGLGRLVSATYPLDRYQEAIDHAANAGSRGAVKIAFDLRSERRR